MKTLALADGDLVVTPAGHKTVSGSAKIQQDLTAALVEPYGNDRFNRDFGSTVRNYVGQALDPEIEMLVEAEVNRVIQAYVVTQRREVLSDNLAQRQSRFDTSDVVRAIRKIDVSLSYDTVRVSVVLVTLAGDRVTLTNTVGA